jgi:hypothetical protein
MTPLAAALDALVQSRMSEAGIARVSKVEVLEQLKCPLAAFNRVVPELYTAGLFWDGGDTWTRSTSLSRLGLVLTLSRSQSGA